MVAPTQSVALKEHMWRRGFTLIELLVVVSIMLLVAGAGLANFNRYKEKQSVKGYAERFRQLAVVAKTKADTRQTPSTGGCDPKTNPVTAFHLVANATLGTVEVKPVCGGTEVSAINNTDTLTLPSNFNLNQDVSVYFYSLHRGIEGVPVSVEVSNGNFTFGFSIDSHGNISQVEEI